MKECEQRCTCKEDDAPNYTEYFIAHAGGALDGLIYTNSVEALDLSYSKGCRLFELDLILTSDDKIVAAHDWNYYKTIAGYLGIIDNTPLTEQEFLSYKIYEKYTPLNMEGINNWFRAHPTATLITDKLNEPERINNEFKFLDRVIMELFTWEAVDKAIELEIKPMVSDNLVFGSSEKAIALGIIPRNAEVFPFGEKNIENMLEDKKIEYICIDRNRIKWNEDLFRRLKNKGIKNYVYNLQPIGGQPAEEYVWNYEMNFCYGMYADNLDLLSSLLNNQITKK
jgi:hypothetical protein